MKPEMGIFMVQSISANKCYLEVTQNLRGAVNGTRFKLKGGVHPTANCKRIGRNVAKPTLPLKFLSILITAKMRRRLITKTNWLFYK